MKKQNLNKGITTITLIITVILMLILTAVTISLVVDGGLFEYAGESVAEMENTMSQQQQIADEMMKDYLDKDGNFNAEKWDKDAAPEDLFFWASDDPNSEGYGTVVGYTGKIENYSTLRFPSRCTKIDIWDWYISMNVTEELTAEQIRSFVQNIKEIELPQTVTEIGGCAFGRTYGTGYSFTSLEKINIPSGVIKIGNGAFQNCTKLTSIRIPESINTIGNNAFYGCTGLKTVTIYNNVTSIGMEAFFGCTSLPSITVPQSVTYIGGMAFKDIPIVYYSGTATGSPWGAKLAIDGVLKEWDQDAAPEQVFIWASNDPNNEGYGTVVGYTANINNYPTLRFPSRCTKIEIDASYINSAENDTIRRQMRAYTENIKEIELPETVIEIGKEAFGNYNFGSLKKINIPDTITKIGDLAFYSCGSLRSIKIPAGVTEIGKNAFSLCTSLTDVRIPDSVTSIGDNAFYNVPYIVYSGTATGSPWGAALVSPVVLAETEEWSEAGEWDRTATPEDVFIWASDNPKDEGYRVIVGFTTNIQNYTTLRFPSRCKVIVNNYNSESMSARLYMPNIKEIELPETILGIGDHTFSRMPWTGKGHNFTALEKINIPNSVIVIAQEAFYGCEKIPSVTIPDSVKYIGTNAFYKVSNIIYNGTATGSPWGALSVN